MDFMNTKSGISIDILIKIHVSVCLHMNMRSVSKERSQLTKISIFFTRTLSFFLSVTLTVARSVFRDLLVPPEPPEKHRSEKLSGSMRTKVKHDQNLDLLKILL